ncbi:MAG: ankyrin repeat domain-containing protein [Alphaproteobacteria bacterium]|nr:ankyrin repeat domain-containing protein [Alphaproteobacteria bacterium]
MTEAETLLTALKRRDVDAVQAALSAGADPHATDRTGVPAIVLAVVQGCEAAIEPLLEAGSAVDAADPHGNTALMQACARARLDAARLLLAGGADPRHANKWGQGPRDWAVWAANGPEIVALLDSRS